MGFPDGRIGHVPSGIWDIYYIGVNSAEDFPGYCAPTVPLISGSSTSASSVQVLDFEENGLLVRYGCLYELSVRQTSGFAFGVLQIPPRGGSLAAQLTIPPAGVVRGPAPLKRVRPAGRTTSRKRPSKAWPFSCGQGRIRTADTTIFTLDAFVFCAQYDAQSPLLQLLFACVLTHC